jgi:hypothetical protein
MHSGYIGRRRNELKIARYFRGKRGSTSLYEDFVGITSAASRGEANCRGSGEVPRS